MKPIVATLLSLFCLVAMPIQATAQNHSSSFSFREMQRDAPPLVHSQVFRSAISTSWQITPASYMQMFPPNHRLGLALTAKNLTIHLITSANAPQDYSVISLHQAMRDGSAKVLETGSVSRLRIQNQGTNTIFVHAGDIVKGGRQDRMSRHDVLISPFESAEVPAFCVEHGRWSERSGESSSLFSASRAGNGFVGSIAVAARLEGNQSAVWENVNAIQRNLSSRLGSDVTSRASRTSLELTLGHSAVQAAKLPYFEALKDLPSRQPNAVGYMAFVDGRFAGADTYANPKMFKQMWAKVLSARVTDALISGDVVGPANVKPYVGETNEQQINARTTQVTDASDGLVVFRTIDRDAENATVHISAVRR